MEISHPVLLEPVQNQEVEQNDEEKFQLKMELALKENELYKEFPSLTKLSRKPSKKSDSMKQRIRNMVDSYLMIKEIPATDISEMEWLMLLMRFAEKRGKSTYETGQKGISPATAANYVALLRKVLMEISQEDVDVRWPDFKYLPAYWARDLSKVKLYKRNPAQYRTMEQLKGYLEAAKAVAIDQGNSTALAYYANLAQPVMSIILTLAGCRSGTLLDMRPESVYIGEVQTEDGTRKIAVALSGSGSKMDPDNQKTAPIAFMELEDEDICPVRHFLRWIAYLGFKYNTQGLLWPLGMGREKPACLFPNYSDGTKRVGTSYLTKMVSPLL